MCRDPRVGASRGTEKSAGPDRKHGQRDVDKEDRSPTQERGESPSDDRPQGPGDRRRATHRAQGPTALRTRIGVADDGDGGGQHEGSPQALQDAKDKQHAERRAEAGTGGRPRKQDRTHHEHTPKAERVPEPAAEDEESRQHQQARVEDPLSGLSSDAELVNDAREDQRDRRLVDQHHAVGDGYRHQDNHPQGRSRLPRARGGHFLCGSGKEGDWCTNCLFRAP